MHPRLVSTDAAFLDIVQRLAGQSELCLDCEFHGEGRYYPKLCLVQLAFGDELWAIDPRRINITALAPFLQSGSVRKLVHDGRQDLPILAKATGATAIPGVFDTQIAAAFAGYGGSVGYGVLVRDVCGAMLDKSLQVSDWTRELSDAQIEYALDDVRYLSKLSTDLRSRLAERGRLDWATEASEEAALRALRRPDPDKLYRRVPSVSRLSPEQLGILREIAKWRDHVAQTMDKPTPGVANDLALKSMALQPPRDLRSLEKVRGLGLGRIQPWANQLLDAIVRGSSRPEINPKLQLSAEQAVLIDGLVSLLGIARRFVAFRDDIAPEILSDQAELRTLAEWHLDQRTGDVSLGVLSGWRRSLLGDFLLSVLSGEVGFVVDAQSPSGIGVIST
ncbi:MAG TPA: HRDC domain-containing protein [Polyangiaceae bacterium]